MNNSNRALDQMSDAVAHAVLFFSRTKATIRAPASAARAAERVAPVDLEYRGPLAVK